MPVMSSSAASGASLTGSMLTATSCDMVSMPSETRSFRLTAPSLFAAGENVTIHSPVILLKTNDTASFFISAVFSDTACTIKSAIAVSISAILNENVFPVLSSCTVRFIGAPLITGESFTDCMSTYTVAVSVSP